MDMQACVGDPWLWLLDCLVEGGDLCASVHFALCGHAAESSPHLLNAGEAFACTTTICCEGTGPRGKNITLFTKYGVG